MLDMTEAARQAQPVPRGAAQGIEDYHRVRVAIEFISARWRHQPSQDDIAAHVGLSPSHMHHLFRRWAGLTPKAFLQALTIDRARDLLRESASVLETSFEVGLSGPGRLHDLFVSHEAMTPGDFKRKGQGLTLLYGFHPSPFGEALVVAAPLGLAGLGFVDDGDRAAALADMQSRWPMATLVNDQPGTALYARRAFDPALWQSDQPLRVVLIGTDFEVRVWGDAAAHPAWPRNDLWHDRRTTWQAESSPGSRRGGRQKPSFLRRAMPPRDRRQRRPDGIPLGSDTQAGDHRLGGRAARRLRPSILSLVPVVLRTAARACEAWALAFALVHRWSSTGRSTGSPARSRAHR